MKLSVRLIFMIIILHFTEYDRASNLWQELELASNFESDQRASVNWQRKWLLHFTAGKKTTCFS